MRSGPPTLISLGALPAVPARQRCGRSTSISRPPAHETERAYTWRSVTRWPEDKPLRPAQLTLSGPLRG